MNEACEYFAAGFRDKISCLQTHEGLFNLLTIVISAYLFQWLICSTLLSSDKISKHSDLQKSDKTTYVMLE